MDNLKTEVIQLSDSDNEIPVLVKREHLCATPSLKSPKMPETNGGRSTGSSDSEKEFAKVIEDKKNEIDLKVS